MRPASPRLVTLLTGLVALMLPIATVTASTSGAGRPAAGTVLYQADGPSDFSDWVGSADWGHHNGMLTDTGSQRVGSWIPAPYQVRGTRDYALEVEARVVQPVSTLRYGVAFGFAVRHTDRGNYGGRISYVGCCPGAPTATLYAYVNATGGYADLGWYRFNPGNRWHSYRVEVRGNRLRFLADGVPIVTARDVHFPYGRIAGLWSDGVKITVRRVTIIAL